MKNPINIAKQKKETANFEQVTAPGSDGSGSFIFLSSYMNLQIEKTINIKNTIKLIIVK